MFPVSTLTVLIETILIVGSFGQFCEVRPEVDCNELCDLSLENPEVKHVVFAGVVADLECIPPNIQVYIHYTIQVIQFSTGSSLL